ncbi:MAG: pimeloyl-ACP methyl ester carboxylesterase [Paracoccaceae bacterium]
MWGVSAKMRVVVRTKHGLAHGTHQARLPETVWKVTTMPIDAPRYLDTAQKRRLAYYATRAGADGPTIVFLGGFHSDMQGSKALHLEAWARAQGYAYLRFDYSGHGQSSGAFVDGAIGDWAEDAEAAISGLTEGPLILVGSSMGGWISLLMTRRLAARVVGLVTIAAGPDFTEDLMWASFSAAQRRTLEQDGQLLVPTDYDDPYVITARLIEDGRNHLVLRTPLALPFPVRFLQGTEDADVDMSVSLRLLAHASGPDIQLRLLKGEDHRFSSPKALAMIEDAIDDVIRCGATGG